MKSKVIVMGAGEPIPRTRPIGEAPAPPAPADLPAPPPPPSPLPAAMAVLGAAMGTKHGALGAAAGGFLGFLAGEVLAGESTAVQQAAGAALNALQKGGGK